MENLNILFDRAKTDKGFATNPEAFVEAMAAVVKPVLEKSQWADTTVYDEYQDLRRQMQKQGVSLSNPAGE